MKLLFIQTGGTIDKDYPSGDDNHGYGFEITTPAFERILQRVNPSFDYETKMVLQKDSLDITDEDRQAILAACKESLADKIVITHGTDTMIKTAELLAQLTDKTIVLTGAMLPELFKHSDADFNLGSAVGAAMALKPGVYITMNGSVMQWNEVTFNDATSQFVRK